MMKIKIFLLAFFISSLFSAQAGYSNLTNHQQGNYQIEPSVNIGKRNKGVGLMFGYYLNDFLVVRAGATYRKFQYRSYKEDILEGNIDVAYTVYSPRYDDPFLHRFNFALMLGVAYESVKVKGQTILIDPYPQYFYVNGGGQLEFRFSDRIGLVGNFRQYYAVNGSKDKLGYWRFDYGIGVRYYLWR
ncbi:hypothetical protein [Chryseobacterium oncorhynchi]|nr:hypothetical protein [Chryseobacterium oncorhynchi]